MTPPKPTAVPLTDNSLTIDRPYDQTPKVWEAVFQRLPVGSHLTHLGIEMVVVGHQRAYIAPAAIWVTFVDPAIHLEYATKAGEIRGMKITSVQHPAIAAP